MTNGYDMNGQKVRILFDDLGKPSAKVGVVMAQDDFFLIVKTDIRVEYIPKKNLIRVEVLNGN